jgi:hypothetical protein
MRRLPPGYNPGRPLPRQGVQQPRPGMSTPFGPRPGIGAIINPVRPGMQLPRPTNINPNLIYDKPTRPDMQQPGPSVGIPKQDPTYQYSGNLADIRERLQNIRSGVQQPVGMGPLPNNLGPMQGVGDPRLRAETIPGNQAPMQQQPLPTAPNFGGPVPQGGNSFVNMFRQQPAPLQQAPLQQQFSYGGRAGYQMGGGIMGLENGQEEPIFPRLETLNENLGQAEQKLGAPYDNQFNISPMVSAMTGRSGYDIGGTVEQAENFYTNNLGMNPQEARSVLSNALNSYSQSIQPQSMMQMASNGGRIGYQMGGVSTMPMDYGQSLQVPQQMTQDYSSTQNITSSPLLNYGQPQLGQAGGTPLSMNRGGIARLGYQMGGEAETAQMGGNIDMSKIAKMDPQQVLTLILQMLIEKGIPLEEAQKLAQKIIELFAQGGVPAVKEFAEQLKQQEQSQAMASGGVAGYARRQGYFLGDIVDAVGDFVGGIGDAIGDFVGSDIGQILLTTAAVYFGGPMLAGGLGISSAAGAALAGGLANSALQLASGQGFDPLKALIAAGGAYAGAGGFSDTANAATSITADGVNAASNIADYTAANPVSSLSTAQQLTNPEFLTGTITQPSIPMGGNIPTTIYSPADAVGGSITQPGISLPGGLGFEGDISSMVGKGPNAAFTLDQATLDPAAGAGSQIYNPGAVQTQPGFLQKAQTGIQNLYNNPLKTIGDLAGSAYDTVTENIVPLGLGFAAGITAGSPQQPNESDEDFAKRRKEEVALSITQYGKNLKIKNDDFYKKYGAINPFAVQTAANGGIMGYAAGGSMVPPARQIEGGIIELDARKTGGYIPYGKKERVDDVPAMLAKDEFVFTSRAVKAAGGGSARRGAAKMYKLMKQLESKGARA